MLNRILAVLLIAACLLVLLFTAASAATPHCGDRAREITGTDLFSGAIISLDDYRGQWVLLMLWGTGCPYCEKLLEHEIPALLAEDIPGFEIVLVDLDRPDNRPAACGILRGLGLDLPLIDGRGPALWGGLTIDQQPDYVSDIAREFGINAIPAVCLLDPQGTITVTHLRGPALLETVRHFTARDPPPPPAGLRTSTAHDDAGFVELLIDVSNPARNDLEVMVDYSFYTLDRDEDGAPVFNSRGGRITSPGRGVPEHTYTADLGTGQAVDTVRIDCREYDGLTYRVQVLIPGTEELNEGQGLWLRQAGEIFLDFPEHSGEFSW